MRKEMKSIWSGMLAIVTAIAVVGVAMVFSSCTKEPTGNSTTGGDGMEVRVTFPRSVVSKAATGGTEVGTDDENRLDRVTIFVFNEGGTKLESVLSEDVTAANTTLAATQPKWASDQTLIVRALVEISKPKKIYAIANWSVTSFDIATYTEEKLKEELTKIADIADINGAKAYPMLMSGSKELTSLSELFYSVTVDMERQSSKIRANLSITTAVQNLMPQIEWQTELMKITVENVLDQSYVVGREASPTTADRLSSATIAVDDIKPALADQTVPAQKDLKWGESLYITENPVVGTTSEIKDKKSTYIIVQLPYKNRISGKVNLNNYYKLYINDTRDVASPHKVLRNTIYNFNIRIFGVGSPIDDLVPDVNVDNQLTVNSWEEGEIVDVDFSTNASYFNIDRTSLGLQSFADVAKSMIVTDVTDWKLVKADGATVLSFAESKNTAIIDGITYTLGGLATAATITVSKDAALANFATQKMVLEAKNLNIPFTVSADNGWIPNSLLIAAAWPISLLPTEGGLQVAPRGAGVLPGGKAAVNDPTKLWKTTSSSTSGTQTGLGYGQSSTAVMAGSAHPAAQYCRDMGEGWFLPSKDELSLIYNNKSSFGASYAFTASRYWSSGESSSANAWSVNFNDGTTSEAAKATTNNQVRCAKATITYPTLTVSPSSQANIPAAGGKYTVQLTSNSNWVATSAVSGVSFSPFYGVAGSNIPVVITVSSNAATIARDLPVVFAATGDVAATTTWTGSQLAAPAAISLNTTTQANIPITGGKYIVKVTSNYGWSVSSSVGEVTFKPSSGVAGTTMSVEITVPSNKYNSERDIPVEFTTTGGGATATVAWTGTQIIPGNAILINNVWWATGNLVASGANGAKIGESTDYGLYFKFGSLIGWSGGATGDGTGTGSPALALIVKPLVHAGTSYPNCAYTTRDTPGAPFAPDDARVGTGDPCRFYLGLHWRTPTLDQMLHSLCYGYPGGVNFVATQATWQASPAGMNFNSNSTKLFLPASGLRDANDNASFKHVEKEGSYWTSNLYQMSGAFELGFSELFVDPAISGHYARALPVRCVLQLPL